MVLLSAEDVVAQEGLNQSCFNQCIDNLPPRPDWLPPQGPLSVVGAGSTVPQILYWRVVKTCQSRLFTISMRDKHDPTATVTRASWP